MDHSKDKEAVGVGICWPSPKCVEVRKTDQKMVRNVAICEAVKKDKNQERVQDPIISSNIVLYAMVCILHI